MNEEELNKRYFDWLCQLVHVEGYSMLMHLLYSIDFYALIDMDENRATDGIDLRYRFGRENDIPDSVTASLLDTHPCSVLEMMVALADRCETHIMGNPEIGDRCGQWFREMLWSLGLESETDGYFDEEYCLKTIVSFLERDYRKDGKGSLFFNRGTIRDMTKIEIWYQMMEYLNRIIDI